jgi:hypothetical protein
MIAHCLRLVLLMPLALLTSIAIADAGSALAISDVQLDRRQFNPEQGQTVSVRFRLNVPARVELRWFDARDLLIRSISSASQLPAGESALAWDGKDQAGRMVPPEAYHYTLVARAANGATQEHDLTDVTGGIDLEIPQVTHDTEVQALRYTLSAWSRVNLRIGLKDGGPLLRSLIGWNVRGPGAHAEPWDGKDASGVMRLADTAGLQLWGMAFSLPDNTVVVGDTRGASQKFAELPWGRVPRVVKRTAAKRMYAHSQQPHEGRGDFVLTLRPRGIAGEAPNASPVMMNSTGVTPIEIIVAPRIATRLAQQRFELVYFIDGLFTQEMEMGVLPATWNVNSVALSPGEHYLTVNLRGYDGTFGYGSLKVYVPPKSRANSGKTGSVDTPTGGRP